MKDKNSMIYSIWSIVRFIMITILFMVIINVVPLVASGKLNSGLMNYSIAISLFLGAFVDIKWIEKKSVTEIGLCFRAKDILFFVVGILLAVSLCGAVIGMVSIVRGDNLFPVAVREVVNPKRSLPAFLVIPFSEELIHRGYFMGHTFQRLTYWKRSLLSSFLFSLSHWLGSGYSSFFVFLFAMVIGTFLFGLLFNNIRWLSGSIWMGFALHWFFNFIFTCTFLDTKNYDLAMAGVLVLLVGGVMLTGQWLRSNQVSTLLLHKKRKYQI